MSQPLKIRSFIDTVGFAHTPHQVDEVMSRINKLQQGEAESRLIKAGITDKDSWKLAISPHDDHTYVGSLYPTVLKNIHAKTIILIGVAHKAKTLNLEDQLIFDSYSYWKAPYGNIKISNTREELMKNLPFQAYQINDSMQKIEHSVEAINPFLQYYNRDIEIVSILVPYMSYDRMNELGKLLAESIDKTAKQNNWTWGKDYAIVASTDAVHYGDEDWGGKNFARFGADSGGYEKAVAYEHEIINNCLTGEVKPEKIKLFTQYTVQSTDHKEYKWTWCGRYSVPLAMLTSFHLETILKTKLEGTFLGYSTSIDRKPIPVDDIGIGITAPANIRHWVGYPAIGFK